MKEWTDFFMIVGAAAATLTGLIFVGISINLTRILSSPKLPSRASQALVLLLTVLIVTALYLVPGQSSCLLRLEFLCIGILVWFIASRTDFRGIDKTDKENKRYYILNAIFTQFSVLPYIVSGIVLLTGNSNGIYLMVPGVLFSFIKSVIDAWVLLVEINR